LFLRGLACLAENFACTCFGPGMGGAPLREQWRTGQVAHARGGGEQPRRAVGVALPQYQIGCALDATGNGAPVLQPDAQLEREQPVLGRTTYIIELESLQRPNDQYVTVLEDVITGCRRQFAGFAHPCLGFVMLSTHGAGDAAA